MTTHETNMGTLHSAPQPKIFNKRGVNTWGMEPCAGNGHNVGDTRWINVGVSDSFPCCMQSQGWGLPLIDVHTIQRCRPTIILASHF